MTILEQKTFIAAIPPFDKLQAHELDIVANAMDIAYFKSGDTVIHPHTVPAALYIIIKGIVQEICENEIISLYTSQDSFDAISLLDGESHNSFVVQEELICYVLPKSIFLNFIRSNLHFGGFYRQDVSKRLAELIHQRGSKELTPFMTAKVKEVCIHPPSFVDAETSVHAAVQLMVDTKADFVLVRRGQETGIVTDKDLRDHVVLNRYPLDDKVGQIATYNLINTQLEDFLLSALLAMVENSIKHLLVLDRDEIVGVLEQIDLLGYLSNNTCLIAVQIDRAQDKAHLKMASQNMLKMIQAFQSSGMKISHIMQWVRELNRQLFKKLFLLLAPPELVANSCLIVMGSEGRGEQILKTDQDNGLILRDGFSCENLTEITKEFTETLIDFGYPPCRGNIMINNPKWCQSLSAFKTTIFEWVVEFKAPLLSLAIFFDAQTLAGDETLLVEIKNYLHKCLQNNQTVFSHFAKATLAFETPLSLFTTFVVERNHDNQIDIKKGGIFPIVHGVRSLALEYNIQNTNTLERIEILKEKNIFEESFALELQEAFNFMTALRLRFELERVHRQESYDNYITPSRLNKLERDLLKDSFKIVNNFKKFVTYHYKLDRII